MPKLWINAILYSVDAEVRDYVEKLEEALRIYADENNYIELASGRTSILVDGGRQARDALNGD